MTERRWQRILQVLSRRQPDLTVLAEAVHKPHNLSAILRSCDAVGIGCVHAVNPTGGVPTYSETSASADKWVELVVHPTLEAAIAHLRAQNLQLLAAHLSSTALDYREVDYTRPTGIIVGNEKSGVSETAAALADHHIQIPMLGMVPSLNVSVATAVILFEAQRQRLQAGLYAQPRLSPEQMARQAFAWLYPEEAAQYQQTGQPFPDLDTLRARVVGVSPAPP
ncbi:MAG: tRNA (guanosine(18)-2'-O)-methyltransferase TrmH [Gloeomargarita sp. SKYBB_i_bin120]|nr:tRNA (guanosine(18)-2'-O)-methyltransferase TrmH [Gloeomargarita sp. SKYG98]MCS7292211.1 tRNA (guanosine(18)-2'-O)-methyltransferase TrmH [Gloeomargarita sp. SKYB120]MDW8177772.1 tRNA (guanosine(18)-2'-O)-methyltransferase TrmH [Gloeomargarita sp. SKYBB_i_bin120]